MANGEWRMANGEWQMANGEWQMANSKWRMANGEWRIANGKWQINVIKLRPDRFPEVAFQAGFGLIRCGCMLKSDPDNLSGLG